VKRIASSNAPSGISIVVFMDSTYTINWNPAIG
jgi:hypothetical protein